MFRATKRLVIVYSDPDLWRWYYHQVKNDAHGPHVQIYRLFIIYNSNYALIVIPCLSWCAAFGTSSSQPYRAPKLSSSQPSTRHHPTRRLRQARGQLFRRKNHRLWHALLRAYHRAQRRYHNSDLCPLVVLFSPDTAHTRGRRGKDVYERGGYSDRERGAI